jgi:hypothetical protein
MNWKTELHKITVGFNRLAKLQEEEISFSGLICNACGYQHRRELVADQDLSESMVAMKRKLEQSMEYKKRMKEQRSMIPFKAQSGAWVYYCGKCAKAKAISSNNKLEWDF